jgi:hypothetical protein
MEVFNLLSNVLDESCTIITSGKTPDRICMVPGRTHGE